MSNPNRMEDIAKTPLFMKMTVLTVVTIAITDVIFCPFTKVEESFNLQATHDILYHFTNISQYDHLEFPGVVPRTFLGPLVVSILSSPFVAIINFLNLSKFYSQYVTRYVLQTLVTWSFVKYLRSVRHQFGLPVATWLGLITLFQFHFKYYSSRPLPNTYALILVLLAYHYWMEQKHSKFIMVSGAAIVIFRSELAMLFGIILLMELFSRRLALSVFFTYAIPTGILALGTTVVVDSYFWQRLIWPEGEVLWYNTYLNKSYDWGTSPFLWYFYSAIPRAMATSCLLIPFGMYLDRRVSTLVFPALAFVFLYSFLPHKELRFIIYVIPLLNVPAAIVFFQVEKIKSPRILALFKTCVGVQIAINLSFTWILMNASVYNYPGGVALERLHVWEPADSDVHVHIDVYSAQTGVSRFGQINERWIYNKTENLTPGSAEMMSFTHLLIEASAVQNDRTKIYDSTHEVIDVVNCYSHTSFNLKSFPPLEMYTKTCIFILRRKPGIQAKIYRHRMETKSI